jgi:hypothetical protein
MTINIGDAMTAYLNMRDAIKVKERELKEYKKSINEQMEKLELHIHKLLNEIGSDSFKKAGIGTVFLTTKDSVTISDKPDFLKFISSEIAKGIDIPNAEATNTVAELILNSSVFDLLTISANKNNCKEFMKSNNGVMPPGVAYRSEKVVAFRKGK